MPTCSVMQPFDRGKFDKRYSDVFKPAITDAGLDPYRVDNDPAVTIPIEDIERGIRQASLCFADITIDNPNVWFELGYALASGKEICIICSEEREGKKLPFDVQHRNVIFYSVHSPSDFAELRNKITLKLKALMQRVEAFQVNHPVSLLREGDGLTDHEVIVLSALAEIQNGVGEPVSHYFLKTELEKLGRNNLALTIGIAKLNRRKMVTNSYGTEHGETYTTYQITDDGMSWLIDNADKLNFDKPKSEPKIARRKNANFDDDIPF